MPYHRSIFAIVIFLQKMVVVWKESYWIQTSSASKK